MAANITTEFIQRLKDNARYIRGKLPAWYETAVTPLFVYREAKLLSTFRNKVRAHGDWDFKDNWLKAFQSTGVEVAGETYRFDMPGNFHYGYVGAAAGIPDFILFTEAGKAQKRAGTSKPEYHCTDWDDPEDHEFIRLGIKLWDVFGMNLTETKLGIILWGFKTIQCGPQPPIPRVAQGPAGGPRRG